MLHEAISSASHATLFILAFFQTKATVNNFISLSQSSPVFLPVVWVIFVFKDSTVASMLTTKF